MMPSDDLQDIVDSLATTPETVASLVNRLSNRQLRFKNSPEEFSALENVCHLRDIEIEGYGERIVRILNENEPLLPDVDGGRLAVERDYNSQSLELFLQDFALARGRNIELLKGLSASQLKREGTLEGVGIISLQTLLQMMRDHDDDHIRELGVIRKRFETLLV